MRFTVTGRVPDLDVIESITWDDGRLVGLTAFIRYIESIAALYDGQPVGPVGGPVTFERHLEDSLSAAMIFRGVFDRGAVWSGDVPVAPAIPVGAVG